MPRDGALIATTIRVRSRPNPFLSACDEHWVPADSQTVDQLARLVQPRDYLREQLACDINGTDIPAAWWGRVRPKAGATVTFHPLPRSRSQENATSGSILSTALIVVGSILLLVPGAQGFGVALIVAGTAAGIATSLLLAPKQDLSGDTGRDSPTYAIAGSRNEVAPWSPVASLLGRFRFAPRHAAVPYTEVVGNTTYWRAIFGISVGLVDDPTIEIGETSVDQYTEVETEFRRGWHTSQISDQGDWNASGGSFPAAPSFSDHWTVSVAGTVDGVDYAVGQTITRNHLGDGTTAAGWDVDQFAPLTLYPDDVAAEQFNALVTTDWQRRTTALNADEISFDITFQNGLVNYSGKGDKRTFTVFFEWRYSPKDADDWTTVAFHVTGKQASPLIYGTRFKVDRSVAPNGQFDVELRRITPDQTDERTSDDCNWTQLQTITSGSPVPMNGVAYLGMRIRASDQLSGPLNQVFFTTQRIARDWDGAAWTWRPTSSPAAMYRLVVQEPLASSRAQLPDSGLDLTRLQEWAVECGNRGFECNAYLDAKGNVRDVMGMVARTGRATPGWRDGRYTVTMDFAQGSPVQTFTPRNSFGFQWTLTYPDLPHAYRLSFADAARNWEINEEILVYADGYSQSNATDIERLELLGVTSDLQARKFARYALGDRWLRREQWRLGLDVEHMVCEIGDRVQVQNDVIAVGLGAGRVKSVALDTAGNVATFTLDAAIAMELGKSYRAQVRGTGGVVGVDLDAEDGEAAVFRVSSPNSPTVPTVGDLVVIGEAGQEVIDAIVLGVMPRDDGGAQLLLGNYAPEIFTWEDTLPAYQARTAEPRQLAAPIVEEVYSGAEVMSVTPTGGLESRVLFRLRKPDVSGTTLRIVQRVAGTSAGWQEATILQRSEVEALIGSVEEGEQYDWRLIYTHPDYFPSLPAQVTAEKVVGRLDPPQPLTGLTAQAAGGQVELRWNAPTEADVQFGGKIVFRHSPLMSGATWSASTSIGNGPVAGGQTHVILPLKSGTYFAQVVDATGRVSETVTSITTKQASVLSYTTLGQIQAHPSWSGTRENLTLSGTSLVLESGSMSQEPLISAIPLMSEAGKGVKPDGTYTFAAGLDLGSVRKVRLTSHIRAAVFDAYDLLKDRGRLSTWPSLTGALDISEIPADAWVEVKETDDDPNQSPTWSAWRRLDSAEVEARAIWPRLQVGSDDDAYNILITEASVKAEAVV